MGYQLLLKGFETPEQVLAFVDWYSGQGEQDAVAWFEHLVAEDELDVDMMTVDLSKGEVWDLKSPPTLIVHLKMWHRRV